MAVRRTFQQLLKRASLKLRARGRVMRKFANTIGLVYFGAVDQHEDDHSAIRGFTASLTHKDSHYAVGNYDEYAVRIVDRFDIVPVAGASYHQQVWTILEIQLHTKGLPHMFFVPTGREAGEYGRLFTTQPHLQPLNSMLGIHNRSPEFHGRYQILARTTHSHEVEQLFHSPTIVGIGAKFWPHGIEIHNDILYIYLTQPELTNHALEVALSSGIWLAEGIDTA